MSLRVRTFLSTLTLGVAVIGAVWFFSGRQISITAIESVEHSARADASRLAATQQERRRQIMAALKRAVAAGDMAAAGAIVHDPGMPKTTIAIARNGRIIDSTLTPRLGGYLHEAGGAVYVDSSDLGRHTRFVVYAPPEATAHVKPAGSSESMTLLVMPGAPHGPLPAGAVTQLQRNFFVAGIVALLGSLVAAAALAASIANPVGRLTAAATAIENGERDVHVDVRGSDELARLGHAFNAMSVALASVERQRRELVADVAHELRTPLNNLHVELEAIRDGLAAPTPARIDSLYDECDRLAALVGDLQELSLADADALALDRRPISAEDVVRTALAASRVEVAAKDATVTVGVPGDLPPVDADGEKLRRVLVNLIRNAAKHGREHGTIAVTAAHRGDGIAFSVADDGPGIPHADLERVFERFYRVDKSRDRSTGGSGLGLAIARRLVEAHGGSITAFNNPGGGATFAFTVPLAPTAAHQRRSGRT